jgi:hypothetical protein
MPEITFAAVEVRTQTLPLVNPCWGDSGTLAGTVAEIDVQARERLKVARIFETTRINGLKADALDECSGGLFGTLGVGGEIDRDDLATSEVRAHRQDLRKHRIEGFDDLGTGHGLRYLLGRGAAKADGQAHVIGGQGVGDVDDDLAGERA